MLMDEVDGSRLIALQGQVLRGKAAPALSCLHGGNGTAVCECGKVHVTAHVVDLAAYRVARRNKLAARAVNWSGPVMEQASTSFASMVWPPLMFPLVWTACWVSVSPIAFVRPPERGT
jgi:hypothetical protein